MKLRRRPAPLELDGAEIISIGASRALLLAPDLNEIEIMLELRFGLRVRLRLKPRLAVKLIRELTTAYEAINPPLRRSYNGADFIGMED